MKEENYPLTPENLEILKMLQKNVGDLSKVYSYSFGSENGPITFHHGDNKDRFSIEERYPTDREIVDHLIHLIKVDLLLNEKITTQQFRVTKGQLRRGNISDPFRFLQRVDSKWCEKVNKKMNKYCDTKKKILYANVKVNLGESEVGVIDINLYPTKIQVRSEVEKGLKASSRSMGEINPDGSKLDESKKNKEE